ncbi:HAMP domain-containing protein [Lentzea aerocolonigenes]|uniref:HAMP domain-containing protein n=1 Tax=Lentzea aerocolonigenes TaxID=68170 RepID=UPI0004C3620B|nr:HAMP domain-containing protein [Lentzea aerocolonigenes]MCP2242282.1 HAMP domain-containing protein [Lentzea aerocolonigenes]
MTRSQRRRRRHFSLAALVWAVGATALLGLGAGIATAPSSWLVEDIPQSVVTEQRTRTALAARQLQRSLNSSVSDLKTVAAGVRELDDDETAGRLLTQLLATRTGYRGAAYLSSDGAVLAVAGDDIDVTAVTVSDKPALTAAPLQDVSPRVYVSVPVTGDRAGWIVAEFTPQALIQPLSLAGPGNTRLLNFDRLVIGATSDFTTFEPLIRPDLDQAAQSARTTGAGAAVHAVDGRRHVVSWAPVTSAEATRQLGLSVVTDRPETSLPLPHSAERSELALLGVLIAILTVVIFGWLYVVVIGPLHALARDAARIAAGDLATPVTVRRYDRLGLIARDLERLRRDMSWRS